MCRDIIENLLDGYGIIMTEDLEAINGKMNEPIELSLPIDKYFKRIDDWFQFYNDGNTPYMAEQVIQKAHHTILASGIYVDTCKEWKKNTTNEQICIGFKKFFADEYHDLKITHKLST